MKFKYYLYIFSLLAGFFVVKTSWAASSGELVSEGNRAFNSGKYDEALSTYDKATVDEPESPHIYFNKGTAYYMKEDYEKARESFEQAALKAKDLGLEARSQFNLGNCSLRESMRQQDSDPKKSMQALEQGIRHYQKALKLDPNLKDAAHNIEVARLTMKRLLDEIKKQQEQQKQQQEQQQKMATDLKELIDKQEKLGQDTKNLADEMKQKGGSKDQQKRSEKLAQDQKDIKEKTEELSNQMDSHGQKPDSPPPEAKEHLDRSVSEQNKAEKNLEKNDPDKAQNPQSNAAEEMKKALESMKGEEGEQDPQQKKEGEKDQDQQKQQQAGDNEQKQDQKKQEKQQQAHKPDKSAHDILDEERENRQQRQIHAPGSYRAVDKDW